MVHFLVSELYRSQNARSNDKKLFLRFLYYNITVNIPTYVETRGDIKCDVIIRKKKKKGLCIFLT